MQNSLPEETDSQAARDLRRIYNLSERYGFNTYRKLVNQATGSGDSKRVGFTLTPEQSEILQNLPIDVRKRVDYRFLQDPAKYSTIENFQQLIDDTKEDYAIRIKRDSDGRNKRIRFFRDYDLAMESEEYSLLDEDVQIKRERLVDELKAAVERNEITQEESNNQLDIWNKAQQAILNRQIQEEVPDYEGVTAEEYAGEETDTFSDDDEPADASGTE